MPFAETAKALYCTFQLFVRLLKDKIILEMILCEQSATIVEIIARRQLYVIDVEQPSTVSQPFNRRKIRRVIPLTLI